MISVLNSIVMAVLVFGLLPAFVFLSIKSMYWSGRRGKAVQKLYAKLEELAKSKVVPVDVQLKLLEESKEILSTDHNKIAALRCQSLIEFADGKLAYYMAKSKKNDAEV